MMPTPAAINHFFAEHVIDHFKPAWIKIQAGKALTWQGDFSAYDLEEIHVGADVEKIFPCLQGMLDDIEEPLSLMYMELSDGLYVHIHLFCADGSDWLLLLNASESAEIDKHVQQVANEQTLRSSQQNKIMDRYLGSAIANKLSLGLTHLNVEGERRHITTLFADIRGFTSFNESHDPVLVMATINEYLHAMLQPVLDGQGMVDKIIGDGVMAVFGIIPSEEAYEELAMQAAKKIQHAISELNQKRASRGLVQLGIGVGIASGEAVLGVLGNRDRRTFTVIGRHVNLASRLESQALAGEIILDQATYQSLTSPSANSKLRQQQLKGIDGKTTMYIFKPYEPFC
ncbi:MAG: adenylate/guanylate cyclase domain-containing protein [Mariprofundaceae bacterium]